MPAPEDQTAGDHPNFTIRLIALSKLAKALLLLTAGFGVLGLINRDLEALSQHWISLLHVDPHNRHIHRLLAKLTTLDRHTLEQISAGSFFYAGVLLTEGIGLWFDKRWASYLTVLVTASFIPLEIRELKKHFTGLKVGLLVVNILVVIYLASRLWHASRRRQREVDSSARASPSAATPNSQQG